MCIYLQSEKCVGISAIHTKARKANIPRASTDVVAAQKGILLYPKGIVRPVAS